MKKMKKTTMVFLALIMLMIANFTVAAAYSYNFTIIRANPVYTSAVSKNKSADYGMVSVLSSTATSNYTTYNICSYTTGYEVTQSARVKNVRGKSGQMSYYNKGLEGSVMLRGVDADLTAPNYATVKGYWSPTQTLA